MNKRMYEDHKNLSVNEKWDYDSAINDFNRDQKYHDFTIPKEWDENFREIIHEKEPKHDYSQWKKRVAAVACMVLLVGVLGTMWAQPVEGDSLREFFSAFFEKGKYSYLIYGTDPELAVDRVEVAEETEISFKSETLDLLLKEVRDVIKIPMFYYSDIFENYTIIEAAYNRDFEYLKLELEIENGSVYITQDNLWNNTGNGITTEREILLTVYNKNLGVDIYIYESIKNAKGTGFAFEVQSEKSLFCFDGAVSLEVCEKFAKSLHYE